MYLKRLEAHGFKTFAQRTVFEFPPGVTAIVGPNGSGKSNLSDLVRWVLGEQSFGNLRAKRTEDLVYSGGRGRAPLGFAEAALTIDNSDRLLPLPYDEVTIGRRAYRNGDNEYTINRSRVRLRDVLSAVAPLGSSYTIINQGLVDLALALQPEERRRLFEDAAEIGPYQAKRGEAERRLRETEANLVRLSDLLGELEPQLRALKRQSRDAEAVGAVEQELSALLRVFYARQWRATSEQLARATSEQLSLATQLEAARRLREQATAELQAVRELSRAARAALLTLQTQAAALQREQQAAERDVAVAAERAAGVERSQSELRRRSLALHGELEAVERRIAESEAGRTTAEAELAAARAALYSAQREARREQDERRAAEAALASQRLALLRAQAAIERERARAAELERRANTIAREAEAHRASIGRQQLVLETHASRSAAASSILEDVELAIGEAQVAVDAVRGRIEAARAARDEAETRLAAARRVLSERQARLDALGRLARSREGTFAGVRAALEWAEREGRRFALVSSLLRVPAELETAIEVALGSRLQNIAVDTWADAEAAIAQLKRTGAGRATFLPLDTLRTSRRGAPPTLPGIRGVAAALVDVDHRARPIAASLLGRTLIADDLAAARRALNELDAGWTIVTLGGELVGGSGAVTGGAATRETGTLRRERELRELPGQLAQAGATAGEGQRTLDAAAAALERAQAELRSAEGRLWEARRRRDEAQRHAEVTRREQHRAEDELQMLERRLDALEREAASVAQQGARARGELSAAEQTHASAEQAVEAAEAQLQGLARSDEQDPLRALQVRAAEADAELRRLAAELDAQRAALGRAQDEQRLLEGRAGELEQEAADLAGRLAQEHARRAQLTADLAAAEERLVVASEERREEDAAVEALEERERELTAQLLEAEAANGDAAIALERRQVASDVLLARAAEDGVELPGAEDAAGDELAEDELPARIEQLRGRLRRMGPVNMLAPDEYRAASERYEFMSAQLADVRSAARTLCEAIAQLDHVMHEHFSATFEAVAEEFSASFTRLFGGGSARLVLQGQAADTDGASTGGIDIVAQPPGKRQLNLQLLSGGERALTAAALLFAILKVNPSPFCILDEVDAALDEANVVRFREALLALTDATQFIIITHNRSTVEIADTLYGISMADDGASRVLSLRIEEVDDTLQIVS